LSGSRTASGQLSAAIALLRAGMAALAAVDPAELTGPDRCQTLEDLTGVDAQLTAVTSRILSVTHANADTVADYGRATRNFLIEELRCSAGEANRRMRLARRLPTAPEVETALAAGEINADHALLITAVLPHLDHDQQLRGVVETVLVDLARREPPMTVARAVEQVIARYSTDTADEQARRAYERKYAERGVGLADTIGGTHALSGTLMPEVGATLGLALDIAGRKTGAEDTRSARQRHHDALGEIARHYLDHAEVPNLNGERPRLVVTMTLRELLTQLCADSHQLTGTLDTATPLSAATIRRLACDADVIPVVLGGKSEVLDQGRATRTWTTAQRRAAWTRDHGHCTYPRCSNKPRELHHIKHWIRHHGPSDLDNGTWLCTFHHWLVHEGGWTAHRDPHGLITFTSPAGHTRRSQRHSQAAPTTPATPAQSQLIDA
jgi:hypothetical protein